MKRLMLSSLLAFAAAAPAMVHANAWSVSTTSDGELVAGTVNESGNVFAQVCTPKDGNCFYLIGIPTRCQSGSSYSVLINSTAGALHTELYCLDVNENGLTRYVFKDFEDIDKLVRDATKFGIAFPLQDDQFRVIRFNAVGASAAMDRMRETAERAHNKRQKNSTKDLVL